MLPYKRVLFLAGRHSHDHGEHEFVGGSLLLAEALNKSGLGLWAQVSLEWPSKTSDFSDIAAVVIYSDGGPDRSIIKGRQVFLDSLHRAGVGIAFIHWALEPESLVAGKFYLDWMGGYYERLWSVNLIECSPSFPPCGMLDNNELDRAPR